MKLKNIITTSSLIFASTSVFASPYLYVCESCPAGTKGDGTTEDCIPCEAGHYSTGNAGSCTPCKAGTSTNNRTGQSECTSCPAGTSAKSGSKECKPCKSMTYATGGAEECSPCPGANDGVDSCNPKTGRATRCKGGYGFYESQGVCLKCTGNQYSNGYNPCQDCQTETNKLYYVNSNNSSCYVCNAGGALTCHVSGGGASSCLAGHYLKDKYCYSCPAKTYSTNGNTASSCSSCGEHVASCNASTGVINQCEPGYGISNNKCVACTGLSHSSSGYSCTTENYINSHAVVSVNHVSGGVTRCAPGYGIGSGGCYGCNRRSYSDGTANCGGITSYGGDCNLFNQGDKNCAKDYGNNHYWCKCSTQCDYSKITPEPLATSSSQCTVEW